MIAFMIACTYECEEREQVTLIRIAVVLYTCVQLYSCTCKIFYFIEFFYSYLSGLYKNNFVPVIVKKRWQSLHLL